VLVPHKMPAAVVSGISEMERVKAFCLGMEPLPPSDHTCTVYIPRCAAVPGGCLHLIWHALLMCGEGNGVAFVQP
jgi:hypothetical protein